MSTDHQKYSTENQSDAIKQYAEARGIKIVRTYTDAGKSGLKIEGRDALRQLIEDVQAGSINFTLVLVYDISRWGRFQDADESAYYEYICRRAGIAVEYCAEQFDNDGSPISTIVKGVKRAMAGEYSRELSTKVFAGQGRLIEKGYRQGGPAGFGLRRTLIDEHGAIKGVLGRGEHKSIQTDRVILTLGPVEEVHLVRKIYQAFVNQGSSEADIAAELNEQGIQTDLGRSWTRGTVHQLLINEKYAGDNVWNRRSFKLKKKRVRNEPEMWIKAHDAFDAIVERKLFEAAKTIINARSFRLSDEEMLQSLRGLYQQKGLLSGIIIDECDALPSSSAYSTRFGNLLRAYRMVGFTPDRDYRYVEINRELRKLYPTILREMLDGLRTTGSNAWQDLQTDRVVVNGEFSLSVVVARCCATATGLLRWKLRFDTSLAPDVTIVVRMNGTNRAPLDYYLFPRIDMISKHLRLTEDNAFGLDAYRFDDLALLYELATPIALSEAA
ncbi:recombinase family protein [Bradyrhizobium sp. KBS0727]|uniref:recombinase family protein n=1 Tax=unclassified Bradyrhizobium TaxID=2631580 RepID=UPI00110EDDFA|nr:MULTISPECIES: recombinase family protein [unclassified Bradyrhizobium]QDW41895.1 recombinase family protein [Bradyrhizobium sp. KBS0725]QDW48501.1 recombinase family protein [Bradyrhizobium sp. KBS0727]